MLTKTQFNCFFVLTGKKLICFATMTLAVFFTRADNVNFDTYTSPADNDLVNLFNNPNTFTQTTSSGITGGAVQTAAIESSPTYRTSFNPAGGLTLSMFMKYEDVQTQFGSGPSLELGFNGSPIDGLSVFSPTTYFWATFANDGALFIWNKPSDSSNGANLVGTVVPPAFGNWLKLTLAEEYLGTDEFLLSTRLENFGPTGTESPTLLGTGSLTAQNPFAAADDSVYPSFTGFYHASLYDNFSVVPEPSTISYWALSGIIFALMSFGRWPVLSACTKAR